MKKITETKTAYSFDEILSIFMQVATDMDSSMFVTLIATTIDRHCEANDMDKGVLIDLMKGMFEFDKRVKAELNNNNPDIADLNEDMLDRIFAEMITDGVIE